MDKGKKSFLWMLALFIAPILIGTLFFYNLDKLGIKTGRVNYGTLIQPAFPAETKDLLVNNKPAKREQVLSKKWTLLYVEPNNCTQKCLDRLLLIKRVRLLMNEQMRRVRTVLVSTKNTLETVKKKDNPDLVLAQINNKKAIFLSQLPEQDKQPVYLLDPLGNLMMYYPQQQPDAKKMIKDLLKLLKYSRLG